MSSNTILVLLLIGLFVLLIVFITRQPTKGGKTSGAAVIPGPNDEAGRICIQGVGGDFDGQKFQLDGSLTIGRQAERCNICYSVNSKGISGLHCQLRQAGSQIELIDLGSSFGTFVNGTQIVPNTSVMLNIGDRFYLANETNTFVVCR